MRHILVIDGQGGQLGSQIVKALLAKFPGVEITSIGTNAVATASMIKAGVSNLSTSVLIQDAVAKVGQFLDQ